MSTIHRLCRVGQPDFFVEDFGTAVYCGGIVQPWKEITISFFTDSRAWGYHIDAPAGSYVRTANEYDRGFVRQEQAATYTLDEPGAHIEIIRILSDTPLRLEVLRYLGTDAAEDPTVQRSFDDDFPCHLEGHSMVIDGYTGDPVQILIPAVLYGYPVSKVRLGSDPLPSECETLLVSEGIEQLDVRFHSNDALSRLVIPDSTSLVTPPDRIILTPWFRHQPNQPVYLCRYYCGTPGKGVGGATELILREDTIGVADGADCSCFWNRIHLPDSVAYIGSYAFSFCPCLEHLRLPKRIAAIGEGAFQSCDRLQHLRLPDGLSGPITAFGLCEHLQEVSMPSACWSEHEYYFPSCSSILLRDGDDFRLISRNVSPAPVTGTLRAYSQNEPITAAGRDYAGIEEIVCKKMPGHGKFCDRFGNRVLHVYQIDEQLYTFDGGPYCEQRWYMTGPDGLTEIELDDFQRNFMVHDGISLSEVPKKFRRQVEAVFLKNKPAE